VQGEAWLLHTCYSLMPSHLIGLIETLVIVEGKIGILIPQLYPKGQIRSLAFKLANIVAQLSFWG
jgi:hypothetical protein